MINFTAQDVYLTGSDIFVRNFHNFFYLHSLGNKYGASVNTVVKSHFI